jgi:hypothetical protein
MMEVGVRGACATAGFSVFEVESGGSVDVIAIRAGDCVEP